MEFVRCSLNKYIEQSLFPSKSLKLQTKGRKQTLISALGNEFHLGLLRGSC